MRRIVSNCVFQAHYDSSVVVGVPGVNLGDVRRSVRTLALLDDLAFDFRRLVFYNFARIRDFLQRLPRFRRLIGLWKTFQKILEGNFRDFRPAATSTASTVIASPERRLTATPPDAPEPQVRTSSFQ